MASINKLKSRNSMTLIQQGLASSATALSKGKELRIMLKNMPRPSSQILDIYRIVKSFTSESRKSWKMWNELLSIHIDDLKREELPPLNIKIKSATVRKPEASQDGEKSDFRSGKEPEDFNLTDPDKQAIFKVLLDNFMGKQRIESKPGHESNNTSNISEEKDFDIKRIKRERKDNEYKEETKEPFQVNKSNVKIEPEEVKRFTQKNSSNNQIATKSKTKKTLAKVVTVFECPVNGCKYVNNAELTVVRKHCESFHQTKAPDMFSLKRFVLKEEEKKQRYKAWLKNLRVKSQERKERESGFPNPDDELEGSDHESDWETDSEIPTKMPKLPDDYY